MVCHHMVYSRCLNSGRDPDRAQATTGRNLLPMQPSTTDADQPIRERQIQAAGYRIHLLEAGQGPLVLFLHGCPETSHSWRAHLPTLASAGYHAVAIDLLGYGRSSRPARIDEYRITTLVQIVADVIAELRAERAVVVGHDWGAPIAWTTAWTRPDVVAGVVGVGLPFGGRGLYALPNSPFGELRPSVADREIAGPDRVFYQEYFQLPALAERGLEARPPLLAAQRLLQQLRLVPPPIRAEPARSCRARRRPREHHPDAAPIQSLQRPGGKPGRWLPDAGPAARLALRGGPRRLRRRVRTNRVRRSAELLPLQRSQLGAAGRVRGQDRRRAGPLHRCRPRRPDGLGPRGDRTAERARAESARGDDLRQLRALDPARATRTVCGRAAGVSRRHRTGS